jgi:transcriptional regulator with XRE-family HTH domain
VNAETFGQRLYRLRLRRGLSQRDVATAIGVKRPYLTLVENDRAWDDRIRQIVALADCLGVTADELLGLGREPAPGGPTP